MIQAQTTSLLESGLFDAHWYCAQHPDAALVGIAPAEHYLRIGALLGRDPHPLFSAVYYCEQLTTRGLAASNPLLHYLKEGWKMRLDPHPLFNVAWYLSQNPDVAEAGAEPLFHFLFQGAFEGRNPHPVFETERIFRILPHLREQRINPLVYFLEKKWTDDPFPAATAYLASALTSGDGGRPIISREKPAGAKAPQTDIQAIAIYLPQFHAIPENDEWWGRGFTEWTNVRRAIPQYEDHYQPHVPHPDLGYYDLSHPEVMEKQAAMARAAGITGFCFYYYWFNGKRLLNLPTDRLLATGKPDFPFCFCWANENWTRTWDGGEKDILVAQEHSYESDERFILDLLPAFRDPRYIRVEGKPLLLVYRPGLIPDPAATARHWRETCRREGIGDIFLARMQMFDWELEGRDPSYDAVIQFPPVARPCSPELTDKVRLNDPLRFSGTVYDYRSTAANAARAEINDGLWPAVCPTWDNTARRMERGTSWLHASPSNYFDWLKTVAQRVRDVLSPSRRFIFINAWNEWAEGCHLEPDAKYGYAWLNATRLALAPDMCPLQVLVVGHDAARAGAQILLLTLLREWRSLPEIEPRLVLLRGGVLRAQFEQMCETLVLSDYDSPEKARGALDSFCSPRPDVLLGNTVVVGPALAELRHLGAPVVTWVHELQKSIERWAPGPVMQATLGVTDYFLTDSKPVADNLHGNHRVPRDKIECLAPCINTCHEIPEARLAEIIADLNHKHGDRIIFGCGTRDWRKGPDLFVSTAKKVLQRVPNARFVWIGPEVADDPFMPTHESCADSRISFVGEKADSKDYMLLGSAFFLSSREDPFPLVALDAADAGLPIVCFAGTGGIPEFVGTECGYAVTYEDTDAAADALVSILSDEDLRKRLARAAQTKIRAHHDAGKCSKAAFEKLLSVSKHKQGKMRDRDASPQSKAPLVSVVVPNYNHAKFLPERLASIADQTHRDIEIILLDDKSTDHSLDILQEFTGREPRARLIANSSNSGSTFKQWRKGMAEAKGKYVWIAESDDSAHPELLATLVGRLETNGHATLAACCPRMTDLEGKDLGTPKEWFADIGGARWESDFSSSGRRAIAQVMTQKNAILNASGVVFRNNPGLIDLVDESMRLCADWLFWVRLLALGDFEYAGRPLNYWRLASSNARTKPPGEIEWDEGSRVLREAAKILGPDGPGEERLLDQFRQRCDGWKKKRAKEIAPAEADTAVQVPGIFLQRDGWCPICEKEATFSSKHAWLRDHYLCSGCGSIPRERALMHVIQTRYPNWRELRIHESSPGNRGASVKLREQCRYYTATQYDPALGCGQTHPTLGYRSENLEKQTFADEQFDLVITQDVMEHIFDAEAAFREIHRTLKPGAAHIFTTPLVNKDKPSQRRAERRHDGSIVHLFPPEYHGNPMAAEGSLVTWHWGTDIIHRFGSIARAEIHSAKSQAVSLGLEGEYLEVILQYRDK